jgi:hypothetical protein
VESRPKIIIVMVIIRIIIRRRRHGCKRGMGRPVGGGGRKKEGDGVKIVKIHYINTYENGIVKPTKSCLRRAVSIKVKW